MKKATERPDYEKLMEYEFFKKYFTAEVAVATWLKNIGIIE
jgi:hypothetical protein